MDRLQNPRPVDSGPCSRPPHPIGAHLWKILFHVCRHWYRSAITSRTRFSKALPASKMPWEGYRRSNRVTKADTTYPPSTPSQDLPAPWADDVAASGETIQWCPSVGRWGGGEKEGLVSKGLCPSPHPREDTYPQSLGNLLGQRSTVWAQLSKGLCLAHLHQDSGGQSTPFRGLLSNSHPAGFLEPFPAGATPAHSSPTPAAAKG